MNIEELLALYDKDLDELITISYEITKEKFQNKIEACAIISAKTGRCGEDCKYCSQSIHNHADIACHSLIDVEDIRRAVIAAKENGINRFCIVTSGRVVDEKDFAKILEMVKTVVSIDGMHCCASLGLVTREQIKQLKKAGVERFNHNINTAESYYKEICTTHNYQDRIRTFNMLKEEGIECCTGVILGMGETRRQRIEMIQALSELNPKTIPINILNPIKGTKLEGYGDKIDEEEVLKTICIFRIAIPGAILRYAGGRNLRLSKRFQKLGLKAGINGILLGNYLTTTGADKDDDLVMIDEMGLTII